MSNNIGDVLDRKDRPAYVRFERVPFEDKAASAAAGHYVARDVDMALITPPYSKDVFKQKVTAWLESMQQDVQNGRMPEQWADRYRKAYDMWKNGQEMPLNGTPIKGWGVISPAQQETLIRMNCLTVEDLAGVTDEGIKRIGMGAMDLKNKAKAWLEQLADKGPLTLKVASMEQQIDTLTGANQVLTRQVEELMAALRTTQRVAEAPAESDGISASDLIDPPPQALPSRRGKQPAL